MTKYYVIPKHHEALLSGYQQVWSQSSAKAYMIITANYNLTEVSLIGLNIPSTVLAQTKELIPKTYFFYSEDATQIFRADLKEFVLEAKASDMPMNLHSDILVFNTNLTYLEYANNNPSQD